MSFRDPHSFRTDLDALEAVERTTVRLVAYAVHAIIGIAATQFARLEPGSDLGDRANYLGEDLTRLAIDRVGFPTVPDGRVFGATDYKLAAFAFLPEFAARQALFVDSKAEKNALNVARIQITQTSLEIRQPARGKAIAEQGKVPTVWTAEEGDFLTTTIFVKYHYRVVNDRLELRQASVIGLPNGFLQDRYNPDAADRIWNVGPNAPTRSERFRTRVNFRLLEAKASWRVQRLLVGQPWEFRE